PESSGPSMVTLRPVRILAPTRSPRPPSRIARPKTTTTAVVVFAMSLLTWRDTWGARTAPRARPPQNPPKEKSWTAAPRKKPCAADAATATRMLRSTPFIGSRFSPNSPPTVLRGPGAPVCPEKKGGNPPLRGGIPPDLQRGEGSPDPVHDGRRALLQLPVGKVGIDHPAPGSRIGCCDSGSGSPAPALGDNSPAGGGFP